MPYNMLRPNLLNQHNHIQNDHLRVANNPMGMVNVVLVYVELEVFRKVEHNYLGQLLQVLRVDQMLLYENGEIYILVRDAFEVSAEQKDNQKPENKQIFEFFTT